MNTVVEGKHTEASSLNKAAVVRICDFGRSFLTFRADLRKKKPVTVSQPVPFTVNNARLQIDARCRITRAETGKTTEYLLSAACKAEQVNVTSGVWHQPNADMCIVASDEHFMILKSWDRNNKGVKLYPPTLGDQPERQVGRIAEAFDRFPVHVKLVEGKVLSHVDDIVAATLDNRCLVGQTDYFTPDGSRVELEYPVKTMNVSEVDHFYQTDTGPMLWPDVTDGWGDNPIGILRQAFIAQNSPDWAELIVNMPTPIAEGISVNHYSRIERLDNVTNRIIVTPD